MPDDAMTPHRFDDSRTYPCGCERGWHGELTRLCLTAQAIADTILNPPDPDARLRAGDAWNEHLEIEDADA